MRAIFVRVTCLTCETTGTGLVYDAKKVITLDGIECTGHCLKMIPVPILSDEWIAARRLLEIRQRQAQDRADLLLRIAASAMVAN